MNLQINNTTIYSNDNQNSILNNCAVVIENSRIVEVGPEPDIKKKYSHFTKLNGQGRLLMPGFVNIHMHFYSTFARGISLSKQPQDLAEILSLLWWRLDSSLDEEAVYYSTLIPGITAVKKGVTTFIDHHASPNFVNGSLDQIQKALSEVSLRASLCYEISDRNGKEIARKGLVENERFIKKCRKARERNPDYLFDGMVGLHASFTLDDDTLGDAGDMSRSLNRGCHIHVLEDLVDAKITREKYKLSVIERLQQFGILGENSIAAHCIRLSKDEKALLAKCRGIVAHNPQSNMNNAVGRTDIFGLMKSGLLVGLGTDGMSADIRPDIRTAMWLHKHDLKDYNVAWDEIQQMVLKNNPAIYQRVTGQKVGRIEAGYLADLILVDYFPPTPLTPENFWGHFLFGIVDAEVDTTLINGQIVMKNKQLLEIDEEEIAAKALPVAERVWTRFYA
jgi:putative selenium metabolism protein SsnA